MKNLCYSYFFSPILRVHFCPGFFRCLFFETVPDKSQFLCDLSFPEIMMKTNQQTENILPKRKQQEQPYLCVWWLYMVWNKQIHSQYKSFYSVLGSSPRFCGFNFAVPCPCPPPLFNFSPYPCVIAHTHFSPQLWSASPWELWALSQNLVTSNPQFLFYANK